MSAGSNDALGRRAGSLSGSQDNALNARRSKGGIRKKRGQVWLGASSGLSRCCMVNSLVAAIMMASLWVGNASAELIDVPSG